MDAGDAFEDWKSVGTAGSLGWHRAAFSEFVTAGGAFTVQLTYNTCRRVGRSPKSVAEKAINGRECCRVELCRHL